MPESPESDHTLSETDRDELCICGYAHATRDAADNAALVAGCERYLDEVLTPFIASLGVSSPPAGGAA